MDLIIKKLHPDAKIPKYQREGDSGLDLHAFIPSPKGVGASVESSFVIVHRNQLINTGIALQIPEGYEGQVRPRSGLAINGVVATFGTIDATYRGEIKINLFNFGDKPFIVKNGERIAQLVIAPVARVNAVEGELNETFRGEKGFGSSGK